MDGRRPPRFQSSSKRRVAQCLSEGSSDHRDFQTRCQKEMPQTPRISFDFGSYPVWPLKGLTPTEIAEIQDLKYKPFKGDHHFDLGFARITPDLGILLLIRIVCGSQFCNRLPLGWTWNLGITAFKLRMNTNKTCQLLGHCHVVVGELWSRLMQSWSWPLQGPPFPRLLPLVICGDAMDGAVSRGESKNLPIHDIRSGLCPRMDAIVMECSSIAEYA